MQKTPFEDMTQEEKKLQLVVLLKKLICIPIIDYLNYLQISILIPVDII